MPIGSKLETLPGTRVLSSTLGLVDRRMPDPTDRGRVWTVVNVLYPADGNHVRLRLCDEGGFITFIRQKEFEVLTGRCKPGSICPWDGEEYPEIGDSVGGWRGIEVTELDLEDDLFLRELDLRQQAGWGVLPPLQLQRFMKTSDSKNEVLLELLRWDADPDTGIGPDYRLETLGRRWCRVQREEIEWRVAG